MKEGTIYRNFTARDGRKVTLRAPRWDDLDDFLLFINGLVDEGADILLDTKKTRDEEMEFVSRTLSNMEKDKMASVVAEVDGRLVGHVEVNRRQGFAGHTGNLGISIINGFRDAGVGQELMLEAETQARKIGVELIKLEVYERNKRAVHVYEKTGYRVIGRVPGDIKRDGLYLDTLIMVKDLR